ncbi:hypothetical protein R3P38DRAFT_2799110 [Favolaschia claudopus]|uniref:Uncharacterized protein n=1 Tax=Favolaschia claudopus TaxID=2862362 RepID=A0AAW0A0R3_9AGAR
MSSSLTRPRVAQLHFKKKNSGSGDQPQNLGPSTAPASAIAHNTSIRTPYLYRHDEQTLDHSQVESHLPQSRRAETGLDIPDSLSLFPTYTPPRWADNSYAPIRNVQHILGSDQAWIEPPPLIVRSPSGKKSKFGIRDYHGLRIWSEMEKSNRRFKTFDRQFGRILCFNGASAELLAGVTEPHKYGMPVPAFPFLSSGTLQQPSSWMYLKEHADKSLKAKQLPATPSPQALRMPPSNPFAVSEPESDGEDDYAGSEADEDLYLGNPYPHEIPTNVLSLQGKLLGLSQELHLVARDLADTTSKVANRSVPVLALARQSDLLWLMHESATDALCMLGALERHLDPNARVRFESLTNFAKAFSAGEKWKDSTLPWFPTDRVVPSVTTENVDDPARIPAPPPQSSTAPEDITSNECQDGVSTHLVEMNQTSNRPSPLSLSDLSDLESEPEQQDGEPCDAVYHGRFQLGEEDVVRFALEQILKDKQTGMCTVYARKGFLETEGEIEEKPPCTEALAIDDFQMGCLEYTGMHWHERKTQAASAGKTWQQYRWVGQSNDPDLGIYPMTSDVCKE